MNSSRIEHQIQWLAESYAGLMPIAMKKLQSTSKAEDAVSAAMESAMMQIRDGKCRAATVSQFFAWIHQIVRWRCSKRLQQGSIDLPTDTGAKYLRRESRIDRRTGKKSISDDESWVEGCYVRNEDVE